MKLSEVIAILEERPRKKFVADKGKRMEMIAFSDGRTVQFEYTQEKNGIVIAIDTKRDWQEVKQPVSFIEAIKAFDKGSNIYCAYDNGETFYFTRKPYKGLKDACDNPIASYMILEGKWYID